MRRKHILHDTCYGTRTHRLIMQAGLCVQACHQSVCIPANLPQLCPHQFIKQPLGPAIRGCPVAYFSIRAWNQQAFMQISWEISMHLVGWINARGKHLPSFVMTVPVMLKWLCILFRHAVLDTGWNDCMRTETTPINVQDDSSSVSVMWWLCFCVSLPL